MRNFDHVNRRTHLYLGLFLMPWLVMYGVSSFMISHPKWFQSEESAVWKPVFEKEYQRPIPAEADLRAVALEILKDCGLEGAFWVQKPNPNEIRINRFRFRDEIRLIYSIKDQRLRAERQQFGWNRVVVRLHFRGGFLQPTFFNDLWAVLVDVACLGIFLWIGSGLVMWWRVARLRFWGAAALAGGVLSFVLLVWQL